MTTGLQPATTRHRCRTPKKINMSKNLIISRNRRIWILIYGFGIRYATIAPHSCVFVARVGFEPTRISPTRLWDSRVRPLLYRALYFKELLWAGKRDRTDSISDWKSEAPPFMRYLQLCILNHLKNFIFIIQFLFLKGYKIKNPNVFRVRVSYFWFLYLLSVIQI